MRSVGYEAKSKVVEIEFQSGTIYQYLDVPSAIYKELSDAESKGQYFNSEIRDTYEFVRLDGRHRAGMAH